MKRNYVPVRIRNSAFGRHVSTQWRDPEVRQAARDLGFLYGAHKLLQKAPNIRSKVGSRARKIIGLPGDAIDIMREAQFGPPGLRGKAKSMRKFGRTMKRFGRFKVTGFGRKALRVARFLR